MTIRGIEHIGITVADIEQAKQFCINALGASVLYQLVFPDDKEDSIAGDNMTPFGLLIELISLPTPLSYDPQATATRWIPAPSSKQE